MNEWTHKQLSTVEENNGHLFMSQRQMYLVLRVRKKPDYIHATDKTWQKEKQRKIETQADTQKRTKYGIITVAT